MNTFLKYHLTFTVAVLFFFNAVIAKEASIRALVINPDVIRPPIEVSPGMAIPTMPVKPPVRPTAVPTKPTIVPLKPTRKPTRPIIPPKPTRKPTFPIKVPTRQPIERLPSLVAVEIPDPR